MRVWVAVIGFEICGGGKIQLLRHMIYLPRKELIMR